jgi:hypothetical protein
MGSVIGKLIVWAFMAVTVGGCATAPAAIMTEVAPNTTAEAVESTLCPAGTSAKLVTDYSVNLADSSSSTQKQPTQRVACYDAQGTLQAGRGDRFADLWYGLWMTGGALVATLGLAAFWIWQGFAKPAGGPTAVAQ